MSYTSSTTVTTEITTTAGAAAALPATAGMHIGVAGAGASAAETAGATSGAGVGAGAAISEALAHGGAGAGAGTASVTVTSMTVEDKVRLKKAERIGDAVAMLCPTDPFALLFGRSAELTSILEAGYPRTPAPGGVIWHNWYLDLLAYPDERRFIPGLALQEAITGAIRLINHVVTPDLIEAYKAVAGDPIARRAFIIEHASRLCFYDLSSFPKDELEKLLNIYRQNLLFLNGEKPTVGSGKVVASMGQFNFFLMRTMVNFLLYLRVAADSRESWDMGHGKDGGGGPALKFEKGELLKHLKADLEQNLCAQRILSCGTFVRAANKIKDDQIANYAEKLASSIIFTIRSPEFVRKKQSFIVPLMWNNHGIYLEIKASTGTDIMMYIHNYGAGCERHIRDGKRVYPFELKFTEVIEALNYLTALLGVTFLAAAPSDAQKIFYAEGTKIATSMRTVPAHPIQGIGNCADYGASRAYHCSKVDMDPDHPYFQWVEHESRSLATMAILLPEAECAAKMASTTPFHLLAIKPVDGSKPAHDSEDSDNKKSKCTIQ